MQKLSKNTKKFFKIIGPGVITGATDDDPSNIFTWGTFIIMGFAMIVMFFTFFR